MELLIFLTLICLFLFIVLVFMSVQFYNIIFRGYAPFISSSPQVIARIMAELDLKPGSKVYELGCGKAGFLRAVSKKFPQAECIGIENSPWPYFRAKIQVALSKSKIKIIKNNLFKVNLREADLIYCYLNTYMMRELEKKFRQECQPGVQIISYAFPIPNLKLQKVINLTNNRKIYFYTI